MPPLVTSRRRAAAFPLLVFAATAALGSYSCAARVAPPAGAAGPVETPSASLLIVNARLIDGTGGPARTGSLRIVGDRIDAVGDLTPLPGEEVFDAHGLVLAPGFV